MNEYTKLIVVPPGSDSRHIFFDHLPGGAEWFGNQIKMVYWSMLSPGYINSSFPDVYKIAFVVSGRLEYTFESERSEMLGSGDAVLLPPYHWGRLIGHGRLELLLFLAKSEVKGFASNMACRHRPESLTLMRTLVEQAFDESRREHPDVAVCRHLAGYIIALMHREFDESRSGENNRDARRFEALATAVRRRPDGDWSLPKLAETAGLSIPALFPLCRRGGGVTPGQLVEGVRIDYAKQLLHTTDLAVKEVAVACGYDRAYSFSRAFGRAVNTTPGEFRRKFLPRGVDANRK